MAFWDQHAQPSDWISFKASQTGDGFEMRVTKLGTKTYSDGKDKPVVTGDLTDGWGSFGDLLVDKEYAFTPGANLVAKMADREVGPGDEIRVEQTGLEDTGQPSLMKVFDLRVRKGAEAAAARQPTPEQAPAAAAAVPDGGWS